MNKLDIVNNALALVSVGNLTSFDTDQTPEAVIMRAIYDVTYAAALESNRWTFATRVSEQLALDPSESADGLKRWVPPAGVVTAIGLMNQNSAEIHFRTEDGLLVDDEDSGETELYLFYIRKPDEGELPLSFAKALAYDLAATACVPLTEDSAKAERLRNEALTFYRDARIYDAQRTGNRPFAATEEYTVINGR